MAALAIGGFAMYYVPLVHDNDDRAESKQAKPNTLKALSPYQGDVRKSVLDQDSLKEPLHKCESTARRYVIGVGSERKRQVLC